MSYIFALAQEALSVIFPSPPLPLISYPIPYPIRQDPHCIHHNNNYNNRDPVFTAPSSFFPRVFTTLDSTLLKPCSSNQPRTVLYHIIIFCSRAHSSSNHYYARKKERIFGRSFGWENKRKLRCKLDDETFLPTSKKKKR